MNDEICYISYEDVLKVYRKMIDASDGGFAGVRDEGGILATLDFVKVIFIILHLPKNSVILYSNSVQDIISTMATSVLL